MRLTRDQGLSDDTVEAVVEDHRGFMWFGTPDGLNRYDGHTFTVYQNDPRDPSSLVHNFVMALIEDRQGVLWVGTLGGLDRYERDSDSFVHYRNDESDSTTLSNDLVFALLEDHEGVLWVGTYWGLNRFDRDTGTFVRYNPQAGDRLMSTPHVRALFEDRQGELWVGTEGGGLVLLDRRSGEKRRYVHDPNDPGSLSHDDVWDVFEDHDGRLWVATRGGLNRLDRATRTFEHWFHDPKDPRSLGGDHLEVVFEDRAGRLWIGSDGGGLSLFDRETGTFERYVHDLYFDHSLSSDVLRTIYQDTKGDLWFGTYTGGVSFYNTANTAFVYRRSRVDAPGSLSNNSVLTFFEEPSGVLWIGTEGGLNRYDPETGHVDGYLHDETDPTSLSANAVLSVLRDSKGRLWVGTFFGGLNRMEADGTFSNYPGGPNDPSGLTSQHVWDILEDSSGQLWLATFSGVQRYEEATGTFAHYSHDPDDDRSLRNNTVFRLHEDREGLLWVATYGGLSVLDPASGRIETYRHDDADPASLRHDQVLSIHEDRRGRLWVGTEGGGLNLFDRATRSFRSVRRADGLASDVVLCILEEQTGRLWLSTNAGLSRLDPETMEVTNYDKSDGVLALPFSKKSCLAGRDGMLHFGGVHGWISFDPDRVRPDAHVPPVVLTSLEIFNKPVAPGTGPLERHITQAHHVRLRYDQSVFSLGFAALDYRTPEKHRYAFKLEPFDKDWRLTRVRTATYTNLDPGEYVFRVRSSKDGRPPNDEGASIRISIAPPFWMTTGFRALCLLLGATLVVGGYRLRTRGIRESNVLLQAEIDERRLVEAERERLLKEVREQNAELEAKNAELERFNYTVSHDLTSPLVTIKGFLGILEHDALAGNHDRMKTDIGYITDAVDKMHRLLGELLELSRIGRLVNSFQAVALDELAREAVGAVDGAIRRRGVAVEIEPDMPAAWGDHLRLAEVFQNLVENAVKFMGDTPRPVVEIGARVEGEHVLCHVRDNGIGIEAKYHEKVFGLFERLDVSQDGTGIGLALVKRIVETHGGRIWVDSKGSGQGTTFFFTLPALSDRNDVQSPGGLAGR